VLLVGAIVALIAVIASGGATPYVVAVRMSDASGLRGGSQVKVGDVAVGTVSLQLARGDVVEAKLNLDRGRIGPGASVAVVSANLLGSKYVQLSPGDVRHPLPSGTAIPPSRVSYPVDLDQLLGVLSADTRTRLQIVINEAGIALTGRAADFNKLLAVLPHDFTTGTQLLGQLVADNHTLAQTVQHAGGFISEMSAQRDQITRLIEVTGQTMQAVAARRGALAQTLATAPPTLVALQGFLGDLRSTTVPLGPAARYISATAPRLTSTLLALPAFERAATPALAKAITVAPLLTSLSHTATPVIQSADPTLRSLSTFAHASTPLTQTLNLSIDNALALIQGWARAIQSRDAVGHYFRGRATVTAAVLLDAVKLLTKGSGTPAKRSIHASSSPAATPVSSGSGGGSAAGSGATTSTPAPTAQPPVIRVGPISIPAPQPSNPIGKAVSGLLHYLLGGR
jgi:virulence factor Mce-like protein